MILEGHVIVETDAQEHELTTFDSGYFDAGVSHRFRNDSDTAPIRIAWTYASVEATRTLVETGITTCVDAEQDERSHSRR